MAESLNLGTQAFNAAMRKYGAPETCIRNYPHWSVMLRSAQTPLDSLVLVALEPVTDFSERSPASFAELRLFTLELEASLKNAFSYDKLNYLMLIMVDPDVRFHVIPRYTEAKFFAQKEFVDKAWTGPPDLSQFNKTDTSDNKLIVVFLLDRYFHDFDAFLY